MFGMALRKNDYGAEISKLGAFLEKLEDKFNLVIEGLAALNAKIDRNYEEFKEFRAEVNYKFEVVFDELATLRRDKVDRKELFALEKRLFPQ